MKSPCALPLLVFTLIAIVIAMPCSAVTSVLWDTTHGVFSSYEPSGHYSELASELTALGYEITTTDAGIDNIDLSSYAILVICIGSAWDTPYTTAEAAAAVAYAQGGGSILILADDFGSRPDHINPVSLEFGTTVGVWNVSPTDLYFDNLAPHDIFAGISTIYYRAGGELSVSTALPVAWAPTGEILVAVASGHRVVILGDASAFVNTYIDNADNRTFAGNIFTWLHAATPVEPATWGGVKAAFD